MREPISVLDAHSLLQLYQLLSSLQPIIREFVHFFNKIVSLIVIKVFALIAKIATSQQDTLSETDNVSEKYQVVT